jgi:serine/threonine-protein kinase
MAHEPTSDDPRDAARPGAIATLFGDASEPDATDGGDTAPLAESPVAFARYSQEGELGRGGMGEVRLCLDARIGRRVALKTLVSDGAPTSRARTRFVREAQIQGRLEHPAVVPVYDLGVTPTGQPFFTMKRIAGDTLAQVLDALRRHRGIPTDAPPTDRDAELVAHWTPRRLLGAFVQVCQAVHHAHLRGVIHRDLKPGNLMLGTLGEVYVLDWGVAKLLALGETGPTTEADAAAATQLAIGHIALDDTLDARTPVSETRVGELLGTPGYMAPEQIDAGYTVVGVAADVYALGAILFEILGTRPLHERNNLNQILASTIAGVDVAERLRARGDEAPPELVALCSTATAVDPKDRMPDVATLLDGVERYLEGDRNLALRRQLATVEAEAAQRDARHALAHDDAEARARALAACSRALALDPDDLRARATLLELLLTPPRDTPAEVARSILDSESEAGRTNARGGVFAFTAFLGFVPVVAWMGVRDTAVLAALVACMAAGLVASILGGRARRPQAWAPVVLVLSTLALVALSRVFGPFVLVPGLAMANAISFSLESRGRVRALYVAISTLGVAVPAGLEALGVFAPSYMFEGGRMLVMPHLTELPRTQSLILLWSASLAAIVVPSIAVSRTRDALRSAERRLAVVAWQLGKLVPHGADGQGIADLPRV